MFDNRAATGQLHADDNALAENIKKAALPLRENEIREAIELIKTGKLSDEVKSTLKETLTTAAELPAELLNNPFALFASPLKTLGLPVRAARNTAKILVDPKKRTLRLAILAYARLHGINISENNITDVYNLLDHADAENLEDFARGGLETIKAEYGLNDLSEALQQYRLLTGRNA